ncbi:hypothetical protein QJS10_CPA01g02173 [Acorus calamus]|uniref:Chitinase domain-containing protein 1 n=1 Tax=Acorus calamus TaxID=4465 RepID=A0AAV9FNI7_ACOCL|nr:hypothetical protein QJS10_CPA01g02173 [Acorus calamus]
MPRKRDRRTATAGSNRLVRSGEFKGVGECDSAGVSVSRTRICDSMMLMRYGLCRNSKGYEMAKRFSSKLTHLSPVWYELKSEGANLVLEGRHNVDSGWISDIRANGKSLVLPRVVLEMPPAQLLAKKKHQNKAIEHIVTECKDMGYDGIVLESWSRWAAYGVLRDPDTRHLALRFIKRLAQALHSTSSSSDTNRHLQLVYVIPTPRSEDLKEYDFGPHDLQQLMDDVDGFSLMTYDYSGPQSPGPNAPLKWIRSCLHLLLGDTEDVSRSSAHKVFLGINFYGNDFMHSGSGGGAITGRDYLSVLEKHKPKLQWEEKSAEHYFIYSENNIKHAVFYPSLMSISVRLDEARAWGAGLSIWEIGQGLDYFFDLL